MRLEPVTFTRILYFAFALLPTLLLCPTQLAGTYITIEAELPGGHQDTTYERRVKRIPSLNHQLWQVRQGVRSGKMEGYDRVVWK